MPSEFSKKQWKGNDKEPEGKPEPENENPGGKCSIFALALLVGFGGSIAYITDILVHLMS